MTRLASLILFICLFSGFANSATVSAPRSLEEWKQWILEKHPTENCPIAFNNNSRTCVWYSSLSINANQMGASFSQKVDVYKNEWVALPGNAANWPQNISDNFLRATIRDNNNQPEIFLAPGTHTITGDIRWNEMPRTLQVPQQTGLIELMLNGKPVASPGLEGTNKLWLSANQKQNANAHQDSFEVRVFRKISDEIPLKMTTQLQMNVSGKERELQLGKLLLDGFNITEFNSDLPARVEKDGSLRIQVKSGSWQLTLVSQSLTPQNNFHFSRTNDLWPEQEVWSFEAHHELRNTQITGTDTLDPKQTEMPSDWQNLPAYLLTPKTQLKIEELERGENKDLGNQLSLNRSAWLSFDGTHFTVQDTITGTTHHTRLETLSPLELTSATIDNQPQVVTQFNASKNTGVEIRERKVELVGVSKLPKNFTQPVTGWNENFDKVNAELFLPPGWSLLGATDTSETYGAWISKWNLWDMFIVLIIAFAVGRLTQWKFGVLAAATMILITQRYGAPILLWLNILGAVALTAVISGKFKVFIARYVYLSFVLLAICLLQFSIHQSRLILNPNLESEGFDDLTSFSLFSASSSKKSKLAYIPAPDFVPPPDFAIETAPAPKEEEPSTVSDDTYAASLRSGLKKSMDIKRNASGVVDAISAEDVGKFPDASLSESLQRVSGVKIDRYSQLKNSYDSSNQTQTGVAVPTYWNNSVRLEWNGSVKADETTQLYLVPPIINRIGYLLSALLPLLLAGILFKHFLNLLNKKFELPKVNISAIATASSFVLVATLFIQPNYAQADVSISPDLIREYEARLIEAPKCLPNCASIESAALNVKQDQLQLDLVIHANEFLAFPLPADHQHWWPNRVLVDGREATLVQNSAQKLLVNLNKGKHLVRLLANLQGSDSINLDFATSLHNVATQTLGWEVSGLPTPELRSESLQLQRVEQSSNSQKAERLRPDAIAPFVLIRREINLDLEWTLHTTVERVVPNFGAINLEVPLLAGEAPLTTQVNANDKIAVHFEANQKIFEWTSKLSPVSPLKLAAQKNVPWVEMWILNASNRWHTETTGIPSIHLDDESDLPVWAPWPGESISTSIAKPQASKGKYLTIDSASLKFEQSNRTNESELNLKIRSNQGGQYNFQLPNNSQLTELKRDGEEVHASVIKGLVKIPLQPGDQMISVKWKSDDEVSFVAKSPAIQLDGGSSNQSITFLLPEKRWPLFVTGPAVGPSILIWGILLIIIVVGIVLGRCGLKPLKTYEWILLGLGVCTQSLSALVLTAIWFRILQSRGTLTSIKTQWRFRLMQIALAIFSLITLITLISTVPQGLLSSPDMHILGNNSYFGHFNWYQDFSEKNFPQATVISLPLWCYKLVILLWALWLASAGMKWLQWAWQQMSYQALWTAPENLLPAKEISASSKEKVVEENNTAEKEKSVSVERPKRNTGRKTTTIKDKTKK